MLLLLTSEQIRAGDAFTIANESIASVDLMERASKAFTGWFVNHFTDKRQGIAVYCGTGNNGGDGLAIARLLLEHGYKELTVKIARFSEKASPDFDINLNRLQGYPVNITEIHPDDRVEKENAGIIIDALLGTGLNKPLDGPYKKVAEFINRLGATVVAVDIPTGIFAEGNILPEATVIKADVVITFQQPKISFLLPESAPFIDCWRTVNIGIDESFTHQFTDYQLIEEQDIKAILKPRKPFGHKGTYGHALIIAGKPETMGAALLSATACLYGGAGLTTACIPQSGLTALNTTRPEIMAIVRNNDEPPAIDWDKFNAIGIGPGLGKDEAALALLMNALDNFKAPLVIDADALNLLADHSQLLVKAPAGSILTPHMKEFDRLFGEHSGWWQRIQTARTKAAELNINIVLKNSYTIIATTDGKIFFNATGNPAMATGGMGDVLTGLLTALLAQKYSPEEACWLGVYLHGKAGDELALPNRLNVVMPLQVAAQVPVTMAKIIA